MKRRDFGRRAGVSATRTFLPQLEYSKRPCPAFDVNPVAPGADEALHVAEMPFGMRFPVPMEFRDDEVVLVHDPGIKIFNFDALPAVKFEEPIFGLLADDAIHSDAAFPMEEVEE